MPLQIVLTNGEKISCLMDESKLPPYPVTVTTGYRFQESTNESNLTFEGLLTADNFTIHPEIEYFFISRWCRRIPRKVKKALKKQLWKKYYRPA